LIKKKAVRIRVAGVLSDQGKVLLVQHEKNGHEYWLLPGGGVNFGETLEKALEREFIEETSLRVQVQRPILVSEVVAPDKSRHGLHLVFIVKQISGKLKVVPDKRLRSACFTPWPEIPKLTFFPDIANQLYTLYRKQFPATVKFTGNIWMPGT
jgi:ADP-ribose pyrophosphatase YjhB (NUDIX family)